MGTNRVIALVVGCIAAFAGAAVFVVGALLTWGWALQDDDGRLTLPPQTFATASGALISEDFTFFDSMDPQVFDDVTISVQATSSDPNREIFVAIAPTAQVTEYLRGVAHTVVREVEFAPFRAQYDNLAGDATATPPVDQQWWSASEIGTGATDLAWNLRNGSWTAVVMNADGSAGVDVQLEAGIRLDSLGPWAVSVLGASAILLLLGIGSIVVGAAGLGRRTRSGPVQPVAETDREIAAVQPAASRNRYPSTLTGERAVSLSRGLWLVKWILAVPHYIVLIFLGVGFLVTTAVAGVAILFTGRYPRGLFEFNVGVLRWVWRVQFYSYSALGTDRYPPFTLHATDYPADFTVDYPETLSRGKVLVKWWLLALPHYLVLALLAGGWYAGFRIAGSEGDPGYAGQPYLFSSVLGVLVVIAGFALLFTGRYPKDLFDIVIGINRWVFRVATYAALMTDEYPPFRLDLGPDEISDEISDERKTVTSKVNSPGTTDDSPDRMDR